MINCSETTVPFPIRSTHNIQEMTNLLILWLLRKPGVPKAARILVLLVQDLLQSSAGTKADPTASVYLSVLGGIITPGERHPEHCGAKRGPSSRHGDMGGNGWRVCLRAWPGNFVNFCCYCDQVIRLSHVVGSPSVSGPPVVVNLAISGRQVRIVSSVVIVQPWALTRVWLRSVKPFSFRYVLYDLCDLI